MIILVGFMGAGKTTVGHLLAEKLGLPFIDTDLVIEQRTRRTVRNIFAEDGEPAFRALESQVTAELLNGPDAVVALGGGGVEHPETQRLLRDHRVVYLNVGYAEAMTRVAHDEYRPLLGSPDLELIYLRRLTLYATAASHTINTDGRRPEAISLDIIEQLVHLPAPPAGIESILVSCTGGTYNVHIGSGILSEFGKLLPPLPHARTAAVLAAGVDRGFARTVTASLGQLGISAHLIDIPDHEEAKDLATVARLAGEFADLALHKDDVVVGVGGETACDIAGFLASTYNRGMPLVLVPTTLVAQADAAVGGKASLNLPQGRNLMGVVHQPVAVVADVETAARQRSRGYRAGMAEIIKHALVSGGDLIAFLTQDAGRLRDGDEPTLARAVASSVAVKAAIVSNDEREQGSRLHLNYGHTFGHAIEHVRGSDIADDGEAVAVGMMAAAYLARRQGRISDELVGLHRRLMMDLRLPTEGTFDLARMRDAWLRDKKYQGGVRFVVLNGLGMPEAGVSADEETLVEVLHDLAEDSRLGRVSLEP